MYCKNCGSFMDDDAKFCSVCGAKREESIQQDSERKEELAVSNAAQALTCDEAGTCVADKGKKTMNLISLVGLILASIGVAGFLIIVLAGLIGYGHVFLFNGQTYTKALTIVCIVFMAVGGVLLAFGLAVAVKTEKKNFTFKPAKRIVSLVLVLLCLGFCLWGFVNCAQAKEESKGNFFFQLYLDTDCLYPWAEHGDSYLKIDSNPYDYDSDSSSSTKYLLDATQAILRIHDKLGVPDYVYEQMGETSYLDGRRTYFGSKINISWTYHPDKGLEVLYTR